MSSNDILNEDTLQEKTDISYELSNFLLSDISNNSNNPKGYKGILNKKQKDELKLKLFDYVKHNFNLKNDNEVYNQVDYILNNWITHHINGIHRTSKLDTSNSSNNVAFLGSRNLHKDITDDYKSEIVRLTKDINIYGNTDVDKLLVRLFVVCKENNINVNEVTNINFDTLESVLYDIPNKLTNFFNNKYRGRKDIICLGDLNLSW